MELRKDYFLNKWAIIAEGRGKRPKQLEATKKAVVGKDFFAPGNESLTPPEIGRRGTDKKWTFRWFANKFPAVQVDGQGTPKTDNEFFTFADAVGRHEIIVETPTDKQLWDLKEHELDELFTIYNERIEALKDLPGINYVTVFKNHGASAGASLQHSHSQIIATYLIPPEVQALIEIADIKDKFAKVAQTEMKGVRKCFDNKYALAFTPYASLFNYELIIAPKSFARTLNDLSDDERKDVTSILFDALQRLKKLGIPYNYYLRYGPEGSSLPFHIVITPRSATWAGFELATGMVINTTTPEAAAAFYRGDAEF